MKPICFYGCIMYVVFRALLNLYFVLEYRVCGIESAIKRVCFVSVSAV